MEEEDNHRLLECNRQTDSFMTLSHQDRPARSLSSKQSATPSGSPPPEHIVNPCVEGWVGSGEPFLR